VTNLSIEEAVSLKLLNFSKKINAFTLHHVPRKAIPQNRFLFVPRLNTRIKLISTARAVCVGGEAGFLQEQVKYMDLCFIIT
jgi:hypothetical protein